MSGRNYSEYFLSTNPWLIGESDNIPVYSGKDGCLRHWVSWNRGTITNALSLPKPLDLLSLPKPSIGDNAIDIPKPNTGDNAIDITPKP